MDSDKLTVACASLTGPVWAGVYVMRVRVHAVGGGFEYVVPPGVVARWEGRVAVVGYGDVGKGFARFAAACGAAVDVVETDPVRALQAQMDGHRLLKLIRENDRLKEVPVVLFSSLINEEMRLKGEALGASGQISKPEINQLIQLVDTLIFGKSAKDVAKEG